MALFYKIENQKGNENLISDDFIYNFHAIKDELEVWRCVKMTCRVTGYISVEKSFVLNKGHNHDNEKAKILRKRLLKTVIEECVESGRPALEVITKNTSTLTDENTMELFRHKYMVDRINAVRNQRFIPSNKEIDDIPEFLKKDLNDKLFVRFDNKSSTRRIIILFSDFAEDYLADADVVLVDGTFWSVPAKFCQLITFKVKIFGNFFPLIYILMPNKSQETYTEAFSMLNTLLTIKISKMVTDFEVGLVNSLKYVFQSTMSGCTFHFGQAIFRKIQTCGLSMAYKNNADFRKTIKMILNLSYAPPEKVVSLFNTISSKLLHEFPETVEFIKYFKKQYIGDDRKPAIYSIEFWNCYLRVLEGNPRTINSLEAWHRSLNSISPVAHVNLGKFIDILRQINERNRVSISQSRKRIIIGERDFRKEALLIEILKSFKHYRGLEFFESLDELLFWKISDTEVL